MLKEYLMLWTGKKFHWDQHSQNSYDKPPFIHSLNVLSLNSLPKIIILSHQPTRLASHHSIQLHLLHSPNGTGKNFAAFCQNKPSSYRTITNPAFVTVVRWPQAVSLVVISIAVNINIPTRSAAASKGYRFSLHLHRHRQSSIVYCSSFPK